VEKCTVRTFDRCDDGGCRWGCGVEFSCSNIEQVDDEDLENISSGVWDVGGNCGNEEKGDECVWDVESLMVGLLTIDGQGSGCEDGQENDGKKAELDVTIVKATGKGGHGVEEVEVESGVGQKK